jgi:hypothetical protein
MWLDREHHPELFVGTERFFRPGYAANLITSWIPALDGVEAIRQYSERQGMIIAHTVNRQVNLTKRVQTSKGMRYCPVVLSANGRVKPDAALVNGKPERHTEGAYYLEWP